MKWFCISLLFLFPTLAIYSNDPKPKITFLIAEREYRTEETLPALQNHTLYEDYHIQYCQADKEGIGRHPQELTRNQGADLFVY